MLGARSVAVVGASPRPDSFGARMIIEGKRSSARLHLVNPEDAPPQSRGPLALKSADVTLTGVALMGRGINLPIAWPATMWVIEGTRL